MEIPFRLVKSNPVEPDRRMQEQFGRLERTRLQTNLGKALTRFDGRSSADAPDGTRPAMRTPRRAELRGVKIFFPGPVRRATAALTTSSAFTTSALAPRTRAAMWGDKDQRAARRPGTVQNASLREYLPDRPYMRQRSGPLEVIDHYDRGGNPRAGREIYHTERPRLEKLKPSRLYSQGLTGSTYPFASAPKLPD